MSIQSLITPAMFIVSALVLPISRNTAWQRQEAHISWLRVNRELIRQQAPHQTVAYAMCHMSKVLGFRLKQLAHTIKHALQHAMQAVTATSAQQLLTCTHQVECKGSQCVGQQHRRVEVYAVLRLGCKNPWILDTH
jgi:hypothetical protein